jgi:phenylpyruvate tautomerase PptA (4-oxalocrotonate tautomerase family)
MPIVEYRLVAGRHEDAALRTLLRQSCEFLAEVLECPVDRVRAFVHELRPQLACAGGEMASDGAAEAPYFTVMLLRGRPEEQRHRLLAGFTDLLVDCLASDRSRIRGAVLLVDPEDWAIAGTPASVARRAEIQERAAQQP